MLYYHALCSQIDDNALRVLYTLKRGSVDCNLKLLLVCLTYLAAQAPDHTTRARSRAEESNQTHSVCINAAALLSFDLACHVGAALFI